MFLKDFRDIFQFLVSIHSADSYSSCSWLLSRWSCATNIPVSTLCVDFAVDSRNEFCQRGPRWQRSWELWTPVWRWATRVFTDTVKHKTLKLDLWRGGSKYLDSCLHLRQQAERITSFIIHAAEPDFSLFELINLHNISGYNSLWKCFRTAARFTKQAIHKFQICPKTKPWK